MLYFFIVPIWFVFVCAASLLFLFKHTRLLGGYLVSASTLAVVFSFVASLLGLFMMLGIGELTHAGENKGLLVFFGYMIGLLLGGISGTAVGVHLVRRFLKKADAKTVQP